MIRVRDKKVVYKKKKALIEEILTEREVLLRTIDLLAKKFEWLKDRIVSDLYITIINNTTQMAKVVFDQYSSSFRRL